MKLSKAIKKIAAISSGAVMLGATVLGAMAADLSAYPSPFIKDGALDAILVVGAAAASSDVIGVTDIAASLQAKMTTPVEGAAEAVTVSGESAILASGSDHVYLQDELGDGGVTLLTSDDLPTILADGTFEDDSGDETDYEQTIEIGETGPEFTFDDSGNDLTDPALNIDLFYERPITKDDEFIRAIASVRRASSHHVLVDIEVVGYDKKMKVCGTILFASPR